MVEGSKPGAAHDILIARSGVSGVMWTGWALIGASYGPGRRRSSPVMIPDRWNPLSSSSRWW